VTRASALIRAAATEPCRPWPRHVLAPADWAQMAAALADEPALGLLALWADTGHVHALLHDAAAGAPLLVSTRVEAGRYAALSPHRPPPARPLAARFERMVQDLWGHTAAGGTDERPWLDHGHWPQSRPMVPRPDEPGGRREGGEFLPVAGEDLDQIPLGPIRGCIEPASHLHLTGQGETIAGLEARLGYTHKGTLALMHGKSPRAAARFAARLSGEATVAHAIAFAQAAEAALCVGPPPRSVALRAVMAEVERIAGHLGALAATAAAAGSVALPARCGGHREAMHRAADRAFGHRLMMDCVVPGGVAADLAAGGARALLDALAGLANGVAEPERRGGRLVARLAGVGVTDAALAEAMAAGGVIGRAARRALDVRRSPGYGPYGALALAVPVLCAGDADARTRLRLREIAESIRLLRALLDGLPPGPVAVAIPSDSGEGVGFAESARGDVWHWLRLDHGQIAGVFMRDPGWAHWALLEAIAPGVRTADLPLVLASFGLDCSGVDL
jgi:Ni,Fe-hydrogenase III large subunit